uniref:Exosome complex exonuclease RRP44 n=1 Tax=Pyxicephalus adspersus TaxID=30357 RepID=A0AAV3AZT8_PYXAD|nr:TPA: hypothetical protein GDO54_000778 [Pyxicephalus adspersus]
MLKSKTFVKKTRSGAIRKFVREHYLRDDITCGCQGCEECQQEKPILQPEPMLQSSLLLLITNDRRNKEKAVEEGIEAYTCEEYIKSLFSNPELVDRLANISDEQNEVESGKLIFLEHLPLSKLQQGIKSGIYLQGTFRASRDNFLEGTVWVHGDSSENKEIILQGLRNLNRAMHEDIVAVQLLERENWVAPSSVVLQDEDESEDIETIEEKEKMLKNVEKINAKPTGRVVGIIKRNWRPYCGMLSKSQIKEATRHLFTPADRRIPRIRIETRQASTLDGQRIIVAIDGWPRNSRYPNASLTYAEAQMRIDSPDMNDEITKSLRLLNKLAKILKKRRIDNGALTLSSPEVRFHIDSETHDPIDLQTKELKYNLEIKTDSAKALADSLDKAESAEFPYLNTLLRILATRCMMQAVYFCSGMDSDFHHYGLASEIYTHFTSPIRRYADIIVHRLLAVAVGADSTYPDLTDKQKIAEICKNINYRHKMAQYSQRASVAYHTQLFFKKKGILNEEGYILFVRKNAIVVLIPKFGLEGTVFFEERDRVKPKLRYNEEIPSLTVEDTTFYVFDKVKVKISLDASNIQHQKIRMALVEPEIPGVTVSEKDQRPINAEPVTKKIKLEN